MNYLIMHAIFLYLVMNYLNIGIYAISLHLVINYKCYSLPTERKVFVKQYYFARVVNIHSAKKVFIFDL